MSTAAYKVALRLGGDPVGTQESFVNTPDPAIFLIATPSKRAIAVPDSETLAPIVHDVDFQIIDPSLYDIDYLNGTVKFHTVPSSFESPSEIHYRFIPLKFAGEAESFSLDINGNLLDNTSFRSAGENDGFRTRLYGLLDVSISMSGYSTVDADEIEVRKRLENRERVFIEIVPASGTESIRGWFVMESDNSSGDASNIEKTELSFQLDGDARASFSWT